MDPIWQDYIVDLHAPSAGAGEPFTIREATFGTIIYSGRAFVRPGDTVPRVRINDICADWLASTLPVLAAGLSPAEMAALSIPVNFTVHDSTGEVDAAQFYNNWSYDPTFDVYRDGLSHPITGRAVPSQFLAYATAEADDVTAVLSFADGTQTSVVLAIASEGDFSGDYNSDFAVSLRTAGAGSVLLDLSAWTDVVRVTFDGRVTYEVVPACHRYVLHYLNAYGGWDSFLIEGNALETDAYIRHTSAREYDNNTGRERGVRNYVNELTKAWTFHTGLLTDEEAGRMHHLIGSTDVYLQDLSAGTLSPVVLTDNACEYKNFSNGRRFPEYTITAQLAQERVRR